jgi:hypothetical protein
MSPRRDLDAAGIPESEQARVARRDRKRETRMVVDNAGVRRVIQAVQGRRKDAAKQLKKPER